MKRFIAQVCLVGCFSIAGISPVLAQATDTIEPNVPFRVAVDYTQGEVLASSIQLRQNGNVVATLPVGPTVEFPFPAGIAAPGVYTFTPVAVAVIDGSPVESANNPTITLTVEPTQAVFAISGVAPVSSSTSGGTLVTVTGTGFEQGMAVSICNQYDDNVTTLSTTQASFQAPPCSTAGPARITLTKSNNGGSAFFDGFSYTAPPAPCTYSLSAISSNAPATASSGQFTLNTQSGCAWTASSNSAWLSVSPTSGTGPATLTWAAQANTVTTSRTGVIGVAGESFSVIQAAYVPPPTTGTLNAWTKFCRWTLGATRTPDGTTGWSAEFRMVNADGTRTRVSNIDSTVPYQRNTNDLAPGTYRFDIRWTKTGQTAVLEPIITVVCPARP